MMAGVPNVMIILAYILGCFIFVILLLFLSFKCAQLWMDYDEKRMAAQRQPQPQVTVVPRVLPDHPVERFLVQLENEKPIRRFTPEQLARYTGNYSAQLGRGGFGTVYRGAFSNGHPLAVKVLHWGINKKTSEEQFMAEIRTMERTQHMNVVNIYGYCSHGDWHALLYEYMEHGALGNYLSAHGTSVSMATVAEIATGVARGLRYLHEECPRKIVHYDIKPGNVLLDRSLTPKVAGFGLARVINRADTHVSVSRAGGSPWYAPPEGVLIHDMRLVEKWDVYSFGVLLLSIVGRGRKNWETHPAFPKMVWTSYEAGELMALLVPTHGGQDDHEQRQCRKLVERMCKVAFWCMQRQPHARPSMGEVVKMLEGEKKIDPPANPFKHAQKAAAANPNTASAAST